MTVISQNNMVGGRYEKSMLSILRQDYSNYHIVFVDDNSKDETLKSTMEMMKQKGFMPSQATFVQNK